ncbi:BZ3500_MvSof-1268-A1-R1_Chr7-3g09602 [Microbotryum saponariae]|uniref:BZ3500_MvSof-1268-A1-R1_Chr7-3g09602 protein n=1 Tax=Microbotryum saponariae TaxID=289078 RepID=A0A2X0KXB5_9BASI|nr:BZ3501_MvSof-1269-A2-R1_Chr7-2g09325 [Microbotryum saponariae]SDA02269.1 BZ3500_MvSof-1268-A1-R1_Chr7-3g09602 [Microbotryum saponariae]
MAELRHTANTQIAQLHARYVGTGHADMTKLGLTRSTLHTQTALHIRPHLNEPRRSHSEWFSHQHRDTYASVVGHPPLLNYMAIADGEATARLKFELAERMLQPCGPPPPKEDD